MTSLREDKADEATENARLKADRNSNRETSLFGLGASRQTMWLFLCKLNVSIHMLAERTIAIKNKYNYQR